MIHRSVVIVTVAALIGCGAQVAQNGTRSSMLPAGRTRFGASAQHLYVTMSGTAVVEYALDSGKPIRKIVKGIAGADSLAVDSLGNLYVSNDGNATITVYAPSKATPSLTISQGIYHFGAPVKLLLDAERNLYVLKCQACVGGSSHQGASISVYAPGKETPSYTITKGLSRVAQDMAIDGLGNLYVTNCPIACPRGQIPIQVINGNVAIYRHGAKNPSAIVTNGVNGPVGVAVDDRGHLFVGNNASLTVSVYGKNISVPLYSIWMIKGGGASIFGLATDSSGSLYIDGSSGTGIVAAGTAVELYPVNGGSPVVDAAGNLYTLDNSGNRIYEYAAGTRSLSRVITRDVKRPVTDAIGP